MTNRAFSLLTAAFLLAGPVAIGASEQGSSPVIAEVDGIQITLADFEQKHPAALFQARNDFYIAERKAVEEFIDDYLLERQAQKENVTVAQLLERHVNNTIAKDPDESALRVYHEGLDTKEPFEAVREKIVEAIRQRRIARAKAAYLQALRSQAKIAVQITPPRVPISLDHTPVRGVAGAPLTLVEFADYECPYCQQVEPALNKLEVEYKGRIAFAYKNFPLSIHPHAQKAAEAAECAGLQKKYWEYHDLLLKTPGFEVPQLKARARELGLETRSFDACLDSGERSEAVQGDSEEALKLGLQGTPSFFLNGRFFSGIMTYEELRRVVDEELQRIPAQPREVPLQ